MAAIGIELDSVAAQQLIQPDPPQHGFYQPWMLGLTLGCRVGGRVNSGVMPLRIKTEAELNEPEQSKSIAPVEWFNPKGGITTHSTGARISLPLIVNLFVPELNARPVNSGVRTA